MRKIIVFPVFSFLYPHIETWLSRMSSKGLVLKRRIGWLWYFNQESPSNRCYFLWLQRFKGQDCLSLAISVHSHFGKGELTMKNTSSSSVGITELDCAKITDFLEHYQKKRNYLCMKIAGQNFLFIFPITVLSIWAHYGEVLFCSVATLYGINFLLLFFRYIRKT